MTTTTAVTTLAAGASLAIGMMAAPAAAAPEEPRPQATQAQARQARILALKRQLATLPYNRRLPLRNYSVGAGFGHSSGPHAGRNHAGLDLGASSGTPIFSATPGRVVLARNYYGYGKLVIVRTPGGPSIYYAHQSRILVRKGQSVVQGQQLGKVGSTGYSTGPHLHFEVRRKNGRAINPLTFLDVSRSYLVRVDRRLDRLR